MKSHPSRKYTVSQINNYSTGVPAVGIVSTLFWATLTDFLGGKRYLVSYWIGMTGIITSSLILAYPHNTSIHFAMYYWAGSVYACQATFFAWANDVLRYEEDSLRAVIVASMSTNPLVRIIYRSHTNLIHPKPQTWEAMPPTHGGVSSSTGQISAPISQEACGL